MKQSVLFRMVRREVQKLLDGYLKLPSVMERIDEYIVPPALGDRAGVFGAIALARKAID